MLNVKDNVHTSTTIVSLTRAIRKASITGDIEINDLYLLNTIYKLLNTMCLSLTNKQRKQLISIYNKLAFKSDEVCTSVMLKAFEQPMKNKFTQNFVDPECIDKNLSINYWKAGMFEDYNTLVDSIDRDFLSIQPSKTRGEFIEGYTVGIPKLGKFAFFLNTLQSTDITILDALNNDVTETFDIGYLQSLNGVLIVSKLIYTSEPMFLKIITNG